MALPDTLDWLPGLVTVTTLVTVQLKVVVPDAPVPSVTVIVTEYSPPVVGVPVMAPVEGSMESPGGRVPPAV